MSSETARYVQRLRGHLRLGDALEAEFLREIEAHVEDRTAALVSRGMPERRAQRIALEGFGRPQTLAHLMRQAHLRTSWAEAALGAVPFLVLATLLGPGLWRDPLVAIAAALAIAGVTVYGLWLGRPAWFYPWAGVALLMPVIAGYIAFAVLSRQLPPLLGGDANAYALAGVAGAGLYFPVGAVVVGASVLVAARRDWLDASMLLSPLPIVFAWVVQLHSGGGILHADAGLGGMAAPLALASLCAALACVIFLRSRRRTLKFLTLVGSALLVLSATSLLIDPTGGMLALFSRSVILLAFLLSPALVARQA
jgi:hypothetical protein